MTFQVTCVALLYIAHARAERDASKVAALKSRRGSISSSTTAFDIQATVQVAAVLQRLMLLLNNVVPAVVLRCCQVKFTLTYGEINGCFLDNPNPRFQSASTTDLPAEGFDTDNYDAQILQLEDNEDTPAPPSLKRPHLPDAEAAAIISEFSLQVHSCQAEFSVLQFFAIAYCLICGYLWSFFCFRLQKCCTNLSFRFL